MIFWVVLTSLASLVAGWFAGARYGHGYRYLNPMLHEGVFDMRRQRNATVWRAVTHPAAYVDVLPGHRHQVRECTITDALAHVDQCWCGAKRYGVFGSWEGA